MAVADVLRGRSTRRSLVEELALVEDHARAQGYDQAADWIARSLHTRAARSRGGRLAPPPKQPNLDRPPREHDVFRNLRTGGEAYVMGEPEDGYVEVLNMTRRSVVQVNRLLDSRLYTYIGNVAG